MIDRDGPEPLYSQLAAKLKARIDAGQYKPRTAIPSIRLLCEEFNLSDVVVKRAIIELKKEGYLITTPGKGTYVAQR